ncbi:MAG TPA: ribonuclease E/G, partial [Planctomycetota bacterium]|nr:ribonuclease E/G [Planctomycetota bacterium]
EAMVTIDVNSGKFKGEKNLEETAFRTNLEAVEEIVRQLRLRDLGGLIVCDFIDMRETKHKAGVERAIRNALRRDRARVRVAKMSKFCLVELTRQRIRESLKRTTYKQCAQCNGTGYVKSVESLALDVTREIRLRIADHPGEKVTVVCHPEVVAYLQQRKRQVLKDLEDRAQQKIEIVQSREYKLDEFKFL